MTLCDRIKKTLYGALAALFVGDVVRLDFGLPGVKPR
jgi:hypothetical protein